MKPEQILAVLEHCTCPLSKVLPADPASLLHIGGGSGMPADLKTENESLRLQTTIQRFHNSVRRNAVYSAFHLKNHFDTLLNRKSTLSDPISLLELNPSFELPNGQKVNETEIMPVGPKVVLKLIACFQAINALHAAGKPFDLRTKNGIGSNELLEWLNQRAQSELNPAHEQYRNLLVARRNAKSQEGQKAEASLLAAFAREDLFSFTKLGIDQLENEFAFGTEIPLSPVVAGKLAYLPLQARKVQELKVLDETVKMPAVGKPMSAAPLLPSGGPVVAPVVVDPVVVTPPAAASDPHRKWKLRVKSLGRDPNTYLRS